MDFSKNTIEGQKNLETFRSLKKHNFLYSFFYFFIFSCSVITSGYSSWVAGSMLGLILICITEIIRWISAQSGNSDTEQFRIGVVIATCFSIITASMSIWLYNTSHNKGVEADIEITKTLKEEKKLLESKLHLVMVSQIESDNPQQKINQILTSYYKVKRWSNTQNMTGDQIMRISNCGKSDTCRRIKNRISKLRAETTSYNRLSSDMNKTQQRYQYVQQQLTNQLRSTSRSIAIPSFITVTIMIMLIFAIDYGLWLCGLQLRTSKPKLLEHRRAFAVWKITEKNKKIAEKNKRTSDKGRGFFDNPIIPDSCAIKPVKDKLDSDDKIKQVVTAVINGGGSFTVSNVQKHLQALNFGKTAFNARLVINARNDYLLNK